MVEGDVKAVMRRGVLWGPPPPTLLSSPSDSKAYAELHLNRLDAAEATMRRSEERKIASDDFFVIRYSSLSCAAMAEA